MHDSINNFVDTEQNTTNLDDGGTNKLDDIDGIYRKTALHLVSP